MVYKILSNQTPNYLSNLCVKTSDIYNARNLRSISSNNLVIKRPNSNIFKRSFTYSAAVTWNALPTDTKHSNTLSTFRANCLKYLERETV